jgi:hypothetical protein
MIVILNLLLVPACATLAGLLVWLIYRREQLADGALLRHFLVFLVLATGAAWKTSRTEAVQFRLYPQLRIQAEVDAYPVYATLHRLAPEDGRRLLTAVAGQLASGASVPEAFRMQRALLTTLATGRIGFADHDTTLAWAGVVIETLRKLQASNPDLCYRALSRQDVDPLALAQQFNAAETRAFEQIVMRTYESADRGMRHESPSADRPADFNEAAGQFRLIKDDIEQQFGPEVATTIASKTMPASPPAAPAQLCAARIFQLEAMLQRPTAMAALLIDSALR